MMIKQLIKLANHLDKKGLVKEADYLDLVISRYMGAEKKISQTETKSETYYIGIFNISKDCMIECFDYVTEDKGEIDKLNSLMPGGNRATSYVYLEDPKVAAPINRLSSFPTEVMQKVNTYMNLPSISVGISVSGCESFGFKNCKK